MLSKVGARGQIVIPKEIRDALGIEPGSLVCHRVVNGRIEIEAVPPLSKRSLRGRLAPFAKRRVGEDEEAFRRAREEAWKDVAAEHARASIATDASVNGR